MMYRKTKITRFAAAVLAASMLAGSVPARVYAAHAPAEESGSESSSAGIWTGFMSCESGSEGFRQAGGDHGHAYGIFQLDDRYDLMPFLSRCVSEDPDKYSGFSGIVGKYYAGGHVSALISSSAADTSSLIALWHAAYDTHAEDFAKRQMDEFVSVYYQPCVNACAARGIDLPGDQFSPVIRGTLWSICIWAGAGGMRKIANRLNSSMTEREMLDVCYSMATVNLKSDNEIGRWCGTQKTLAAQAYAMWAAGGDIPTTDGDVLATAAASGGVTFTYDGGNYQDYVSAWIQKYPELAQGFRDTGGWNADNRAWALSLRNCGREKGETEPTWYSLYGIRGDNTYLDISEGTSGGVAVEGVDVNAENYQIPDNGGNNPVVYFSQGGGQPWSGLPFGDQDIAHSGCSITSLAMVVSYLTAGTDKSGWVYPSDIRAKIAEKTGSYNHFHVAGSGQSWAIMDAVAGYYGLSCEAINSSSVTAALASGKPVIMSCKPGEFTSRGHYIVLTGVTSDGYIVVNDPAHPAKSGKKYTAQYIASQGKGWWAFGN